MIKHSIFSFAFLGLVLAANQAQAQMATATGRIAGEIGKQKSITATTTCDLNNMGGSDGGNIGTPNQLLCVVKKLGITGATAATGVTGTFTLSGSTGNIHYVVNTPGPTVDGVTYGYEMKIWTCNSPCTVVGNYFAAIYVAFNGNASGTINQGILINNFGAGGGTLKGSAFIKWDVGTATATKNFRLNMVDCSGGGAAQANYSYYTKVGTVSNLNELYSNAAGVVTRTALSWDTAANAGNWQTDSIVSAGGDSPAWGGGFTRAASTDDYTYTAAATGSYTIGAYPTQMPGATLSGAANQGASCSLNATNGVPSITSGAGVLTTTMTAMGGMTLNPPNL